MSSDFDQFSEAARLYAKYSQTVDEMWELFKTDVDRFHAALKAAVQAAVSPQTIGEDAKSATRIWWLAADENAERDGEPHVYFARKEADVIVPGRLTLYVEPDGEDEGVRRRRLAAFQGSVALPPHCSVIKTKGTLAVVIEYLEGDPIAACVEPVVSVLRHLDQTVR